MRLHAAIAGLSLAAVLAVAGAPSASAQSHNQKDQDKQSKTVEVQPGDYLDKIAHDNNTTYVRLYDANTDINDPDLIFPGEKVRIPDADEQLADRSLPANAPPAAIQESAQAQQTAQHSPYSGYTPSYTAPITNYTSGTVWDRLASCESGGNWSINSGNGFYGGLQFDYGTWLSNGGGAYAPRADLATPDQQIVIATKLQASRGWSPWPACSHMLGL